MGTLQWLKLGEGLVSPLDIPVYSLGTGQPTLGITCAIHGDETAGIHVAARLVRYLQTLSHLNGTIHILPVANPAARFVNRRVAPFDLKDLNRVGSGRADGSYTERTGELLFNFLKTCDLVINIHEFEMHTPICAAAMNAANETVRKRAFAALQSFEPEIIWAIIPASKHDSQYQLTLEMALAEAGVASFPIETTQLSLLSDAALEKVWQGLVRVAVHLGILDLKLDETVTPAPALVRREVTASVEGLWEPAVTLMRAINVGDLVGTITTLPDFAEKKVYAPESGIVIQYRQRAIVTVGTGIYSLGHPFNGVGTTE